MKIDLQKISHVMVTDIVSFGKISFPKIGLENRVSGTRSLDVGNA